MTEEKFRRNLTFLLQDAERNFTHSAPKDDTITKWKQNCTSRKTTAKKLHFVLDLLSRKIKQEGGPERDGNRRERKNLPVLTGNMCHLMPLPPRFEPAGAKATN